MSLLSEAKATTGVLHDWLGEGGVPVYQRQAEHRAAICIQCPENRHGKWWESAKTAIANVIKDQLSAKNGANITVSTEEQLNLCAICGCCLPLKVHVPLHHILEHTDAATLARFPEMCWIRKEQKDSA